MSEEEIFFVRFDNDLPNFSIGTSKGFSVLSILPKLERKIDRRKLFGRGIGTVSTYLDSDLCVITGGGINPYCEDKQIYWWSDTKTQILAKINFNSRIIDHKIEDTRQFPSFK